MALTRKPGPAQSISLIGQIPDVPSVPARMQERFDELKAYSSSMVKWWDEFQRLLQRDLDNITAQFGRDEGIVTAGLAEIQTQLEALAAQIAALTTSAGQAAQIAALTQEVTTLGNELANHIAAAITHKTLSAIVGVSDQQALNKKTIGNVSPGPGRFQPLIVVASIPSTQSVTINAGESMVIAGEFSVSGSLIIDGSFAVV